VRDPSGNSGSFIGHQLEARVHWDVPPGNVRLEAGGAYLLAESSSRTHPTPPSGATLPKAVSHSNSPFENQREYIQT